MGDDECGPLPVYQDLGAGITLSCWQMTLRERLSALVFGRVWVSVLMGGRTQPPIALEATRSQQWEVRS